MRRESIQGPGILVRHYHSLVEGQWRALSEEDGCYVQEGVWEEAVAGCFPNLWNCEDLRVNFSVISSMV